MASSSSFSASSDSRRPMLDREVVPMGEASSSERTPTAFSESKSSATALGPDSRASHAIPSPRKRKNLKPLVGNSGPSTMSKRAKGPSITDPEYSWVHDDVDKHASVFDTRDKLDQFVSVYPVCEDSVLDYAVAKPCWARERVYMKPRADSYDFSYLYEFMFKEYSMTFPLTDFEVGMLSLMNIPPSQLHPNSWAFLRCFELVCSHLGFEPSLSVFTYFYQMKIGKLVGWVSLTASHGTPLFSLYNSSYKFFKIKFFKLCYHPRDKEKRLFFHSDHSLRFLLYWQKPTRFLPRSREAYCESRNSRCVSSNYPLRYESQRHPPDSS